MTWTSRWKPKKAQLKKEVGRENNLMPKPRHKIDLKQMLITKYLWLLALAAIIRVILLFLIPPIVDVFYFTTESVSCILTFKNPYNHTFSTVPPSILTKGAESVFAYLPFVSIFSIPFYLLGDVRYGFIFCDMLIGYTIHVINLKNGSKNEPKASLLYLFLPPTMMSTVMGFNINIGVAFLMLSILFLQKGNETKAGVCYGLSLASLQFSFIFIPFFMFYSLKNHLKKFLLYSIIVCGLITFPFFYPDMYRAINDVLILQLARETGPVLTVTPYYLTKTAFYSFLLPYIINISMNAFLYTFFGFTIPLFLKIMILLPIMGFLMINCRKLSETVFNALIFSTLFLFVLPNVFFLEYLVLPFSLLPINW
jgi:hypothetical protein